MVHPRYDAQTARLIAMLIVLHSHVLAYTMMQNPPLPYRFEVSNLPLQIPNITSWVPDTGLFRTLVNSAAGKFLINSTYLARNFLGNITNSLRTLMRKYIWGDRVSLEI